MPTRTLDISIGPNTNTVEVSEVPADDNVILLHASGTSTEPCGVFFPVLIADGETITGIGDLTDWEIRQALLDSAIQQAEVTAGGVAELALIQPAADLDVQSLEDHADSIASTAYYRSVTDVQEFLDIRRFDAGAQSVM